MQNTVQASLNAAIQALRTTSESPRADAEILLAHCLGKSRTWLFTWADKTLESAVITAFQRLLAERLRGVPIAHLIGYREFWTLNLKVTPDTLIPRPETELLVETALSLFPPTPAHVLDLGTGTGAIALSIASERPDCAVTACDFSAAALAVAQENAQSHGITNATFVQSDWFTALPAQRFALIVSNPPYIEAADPHLQQGDVRFEPLSALAAGSDGLDDIRQIIHYAPDWLAHTGWLLLEHGYNQGQAVTVLLQERGLQAVRCLRDLAGNERVSLGQWLGYPRQ